MSDSSSDLRRRLQQLQSRFTWDLKEEDMDLDDINNRLQEHIELQQGQRGAVARSFSLLAFVRYLQGQPEEALSLLKQSEEKTKECYGEEAEQRLIVTYGDMAWLRYHTGDHTEAQRHCQRVEDILLRCPTGSSAVLHPEVYGEKAWTYFMFSRSYYPKAIECFHKALELQTDDSEWNTGYAIVLHRTEERASEQSEESAAVRQLRRALSIDPDNGFLLCLLADLLYQKHEEADGLMDRALRVDPDNPHVQRYMGKFFRLQGQNDRAIALLKRALQRTSQSPFIHHQLALCYKKKKTDEQRANPSNRSSVQQWRRLCIQHLQEALRIRPSFVLALGDLALLYGEEKDFSRAEETFQEGLKILHRTDKYVCQMFYQRYADYHYYATKNEAAAIDYYTKALLLKSNTWERKMCMKKLKQIAERRLTEDEDDGQAYALQALVAKAQGDKQRAAECYEKALDCDENNDEYLRALSELRMEQQ